MAASSSTMQSSSPSHLHDSSSCSGAWEYEVFLCFRGDDTRNGFSSHLWEALRRKKIKAFIDDQLGKSKSIDELISVLRSSALSIVIFSPNFADSSWCLDEVATIARNIEQFGHRVIPVFYKVGPSDVAGDSGTYAVTIRRSTEEEDKKKRWMDALEVVAIKGGFNSLEIPMESNLVKRVVRDVETQLKALSPGSMSNNLVGIDSRLVEIDHLLATNTLHGTRVVGLWGMGGSGKTTLAEACYQRLTFSMQDIKHHFVYRINEQCDSASSGADGLIQELYSELLSLKKDITRGELDNDNVRARLSRLKVFIVLDDVETWSQLDQLLLGNVSDPSRLFAPGSRIIITSRNRKVLEYAGAEIYVVDGLCNDESLQLFSLHAFGLELPPGNWRELSHHAISYCCGSPLALTVLGRRLFGEDRHYWKSFLGSLEPGIHDVLSRSYHKLGANGQRIFLDVACFHNGWSRSIVTKYMSSKYGPYAYSIVKDLIDMSMFICVVNNGNEEIHLHDLLIEMAWKIINDGRKLECRSRLKNPEDIRKILKTWKHSGANVSKEGRATEGIFLDISKAKEMDLEANAFEGMHSLTFLVFSWLDKDSSSPSNLSKIHLPIGGLNSLPDTLTFLRWEGFPAKSLPPRFNPERLCYLIIRHSPIEICWEGIQPTLENLTSLDLSYCINLSTIPDLSKSLNLDRLLLQGCKSLIELPQCVQYLNRLVQFDLRDCTNLRLLPDKLYSRVLEYVNLSNCPNLTCCPEIYSGRLQILDIEGTSITCFPRISASLDCFQLYHTTIRDMDCYDQQQGSFPLFDRLELVHNSQLKSLSRHIWKMVYRGLILQDCPSIESLPEISQPNYDLIEILIDRCPNLKKFPTGISNLKSLENLIFTGTDIKSLPLCIQELHNLSCLSLSYSKHLDSIPENIHKLAKLSTLLLRCCSRIKYLPELPPNLEYLDIGGCKSVRALPCNVTRLVWKHLRFDGCLQLDENLIKEMVENFANHATISPQPMGDLQYSRSEMPEWLATKSLNEEDGPCLTLQLPPADCSNERPIKGVASGIVCCSDVLVQSLYMKCDCNVGTTTIASWRSLHWFLGETSLDNAYLWYDKRLLGENNEGMQEAAEPWYVKYAGFKVSFRFYLETEKEEEKVKLKHIKLKGVGVSLLY